MGSYLSGEWLDLNFLGHSHSTFDAGENKSLSIIQYLKQSMLLRHIASCKSRISCEPQSSFSWKLRPNVFQWGSLAVTGLVKSLLPWGQFPISLFLPSLLRGPWDNITSNRRGYPCHHDFIMDFQIFSKEKRVGKLAKNSLENEKNNKKNDAKVDVSCFFCSPSKAVQLYIFGILAAAPQQLNQDLVSQGSRLVRRQPGSKNSSKTWRLLFKKNPSKMGGWK